MKKFTVMFLALTWMTAYAEFDTDFGKGWRLTIGPQFNFNASGRLSVNSGAIPVPAPTITGTRAAAKATGDSIAIGSGRTTLDDGAFIDTSDAAGVSGETWNWHIPAGRLNNGVMTIANSYTEQSSTYDVLGGSDKDRNWSTGVDFGLEHTIWRQGAFGIDVGFNVDFFKKNNWFKGSAGNYRRTDSIVGGEYLTDVSFNQEVVNDPWAVNPDGSWGAGTYDGPGPILDLNNGDVSISHRWGDENPLSTTSKLRPVTIRGDLQMCEIQLALKPYYELTEWFMVRGTIGAGVDYRYFNIDVGNVGSDSVHDWNCYMISGLGGMFHFGDVCIGMDFLRKVFDDDMAVDTKYVNGSIGNANWMLRMYVGYEF